MAVGDIYYSDGAITKPKPEDISAARANGKTPIGVIGYLGNNKWTESGTGSGYGGHALVLCLKNIGSNGTTDMGQGYRWYSKNEDCQRTKVNTGDKIRGSSDKDYGSGYKETKVLVAKGSAFEAANAAKNYTSLPAPTNKCTGWFLPSAGQYYAVMSQLGGGIKPDNWEIDEFFENMTTVSGNINAALSKVGPDQYTEFFRELILGHGPLRSSLPRSPCPSIRASTTARDQGLSVSAPATRRASGRSGRSSLFSHSSI